MAKYKLLYVEDEPFLARIVKESLESKDFEVTLATNGSDAVSLFKNSQPDLCVLDVMLPGKDGYSIAESIREIRSSTPIIFVTAKTQTKDLLKGFEVGGNDYIKKPFSVEELVVRINNLLTLTNGSKKSSDDMLSFGSFQFFPLKYILKSSSDERKLSHREATLLKLMIEHKNTPLLRKEILLHIWGDDSFFNSRNLDVYVTKLRDYLKSDPSVTITTIKGHGYLFSAD